MPAVVRIELPDGSTTERDQNAYDFVSLVGPINFDVIGGGALVIRVEGEVCEAFAPGRWAHAFRDFRQE